MRVTRYSKNTQPSWDGFIRASKNGTFLLLRDYMDYHADRFSDHSLLFHDDKERLVAVMPAHQNENSLVSHGGLTYGGIISDAAMTTPLMLEVFDALMRYAQSSAIAHIRYKTMPSIYWRLPSEEDRYALFRHNAVLYRRDVLSVVDQTNRLNFQERRVRKIKQARKANLRVEKSAEYGVFWPVLEATLKERFEVKPVHSLAEIELLARRFPDNIQLYTCRDGQEILAGVVVYVTAQAVHAQYISASESGKNAGALDLIFSELLDNIYLKIPYFDFGISTEQDGRHLNVGLTEQKEGFGARALVHDHYEVAVK